MYIYIYIGEEDYLSNLGLPSLLCPLQGVVLGSEGGLRGFRRVVLDPPWCVYGGDDMMRAFSAIFSRFSVAMNIVRLLLMNHMRPDAHPRYGPGKGGGGGALPLRRALNPKALLVGRNISKRRLAQMCSSSGRRPV